MSCNSEDGGRGFTNVRPSTQGSQILRGGQGQMGVNVEADGRELTPIDLATRENTAAERLRRMVDMFIEKPDCTRGNVVENAMQQFRDAWMDGRRRVL